MFLNVILFAGFALIFIFIAICFRKFINYGLYKAFSNYLIILTVLLLVVTIMIYPAESVDAAYKGLVVWATLVIPALFPFFIGSELLINLGIVKFIGTILEPIMRPVFNVPGEGSFAFVMSVTSGYPVGAKIVSKFRADKILTEIEAQRLISFCSTSGPLFMIGSVAVGMFKLPELGALIAVSHYLGAIIVGIIFGHYKKSSRDSKSVRQKENSIKGAFSKINMGNNQNPPIGIILGNAVRDSLNTILMVGGFITLFAVIIRMLKLLGIVDLITSVIIALFPFKISPTIVHSLVTGLFEITMGTKSIIDNVGIDLPYKIAIVSFIIGWSGFSIHAQVTSILEGSGVKSHIYVISKALHGLLSSLIAYMFFPIFSNYFLISFPVYNTYQSMDPYKKFLLNCKLSVELFIAVLIGLLFLSLIIAFLLKIYNYIVCRKRVN